MAKATQHPQSLCVDGLRHNEYYHMQEVFDDLYRRSNEGETFTNLMNIVLSRDNILLAYRNIKTNSGSQTSGTDHLTIKDIGKLTPEEVVYNVRKIVTGRQKIGYCPRAVRRIEIPKPNGDLRPLGIPCIWDRLIQQCIKQVMEPICEAKFSDNSYGFRPQRGVENAISRTYNLMQLSHLYYVVEFDIKGFFDNVDHAKLIRQIWAMGIHDTHLLQRIKAMLNAPVSMPDGKQIVPQKGTPQGGILSPLLANIVLNELDHWVESNWEKNPITGKYKQRVSKSGSLNKCHAYRAMRATQLKEMYIVRYADDFRIFCRTKSEAERTRAAVTQWLWERLKLEVSPEKTRVVNVKRRYSEFLGFKIKLERKGTKNVVRSHMCDKALKKQKQKLTERAKNVAKPRAGKTERDEIILYNQTVSGVQQYYQIATNVNLDCGDLQRAVSTVFKNRLRTQKGSRLKKSGRALTTIEKAKYGKSKQIRYLAGSGEPIYPIGYVKHRHPMAKKRSINQYTAKGRAEIHENLKLENKRLMREMERQPQKRRSTEYADNRISLFSAQYGRCAVTGEPFQSLDEIHCHHKIPRAKGGSDQYQNLVLVTKTVHRLIHATNSETIESYLNLLKLDKGELAKLNKLREQAGIQALS